MQRDSHTKLSPLTLFYHWTIGISMIAALGVGTYIESLKSTDPLRGELIFVHKNVGLAILILAIARISWRYINGFLQPAGASPVWEARSAYWMHVFLLFATLMMPISGIMMTLGFGCTHCYVPVFGLFEIGPFPKIELLAGIGYYMHTMGSKLVILAILIHAAAALKHHYWDGDGTLRRMLGRQI